LSFVTSRCAFAHYNTSIYPEQALAKVDFHVHTPKSHDYGRNEEITTPKIWLKHAMNAKLD